MNYSRIFLLPAFCVSICCLTHNQAAAQTDVVAFWEFEREISFDTPAPDGPTAQNYAADVNNTVGVANLQAFRGDAEDLDNNGGGGFLSYTSSVSNQTFGPSRTVRFTDLAGRGEDFSIGGRNLFDVSTNGGPVEEDDFGNDALLYISLDATGFQDLQLRFDVEATPFDPDPDPGVAAESFLPPSFDIFYRTTGPNGTWFRDAGQNNIELLFSDFTPADLENQFARVEFQSLNSALNNASQVEIIINDFDREIEDDDGNRIARGNGELEIDNFEIVGNRVSVVPEPTSTSFLLMVGIGLISQRRRNQ